jgi:hypothetical protein
MTTSDVLPLTRGKGWLIALSGIAAVLIVSATCLPKLNRSRMVAFQAEELARQTVADSAPTVSYDERIHKVQLASISTAQEPAAEKAPANSASDRKMIRTSSIDLVVQKPAEAAEKVCTLAENMGGFLVNSEVAGGQGATSGSLTVRVPAGKFEEARAAIRKLGLRVENEKTEAQDVTRQYVDQEASLRNLRAEEAQYLSILKQARTVKDTLEVSEKLSEVRGQIDQQQAEFNALSKQIETVAITVSLRAEAEAQVFGLNWRPLYQMKLSLRDGLDAVAQYGTAMLSLVFYLPAILLWMATIVVAAALGWRISRWGARVFFGWQKKAAAQNG